MVITIGGHGGGGGRSGRGGGSAREDFIKWPYGRKLSDSNEELTRPERRALGSYSDGLSGEINKALITGEGLDKVNNSITRLDGALEKSPLRNPIKVYRGVDHNIAEREFGKVGTEYIQKSFVSTTDRIEIASRFSEVMDSRGRIHVMEIVAKKGTPAISMYGISRYELEREVLLGRNLRMKYIGKRTKTMDIRTDPNYYAQPNPLRWITYGEGVVTRRIVIHKFETVVD